ncbi:hypothetical protein QOT17_004919 [Balamuthia mandrillaris]
MHLKPTATLVFLAALFFCVGSLRAAAKPINVLADPQFQAFVQTLTQNLPPSISIPIFEEMAAQQQKGGANKVGSTGAGLSFAITSRLVDYLRQQLGPSVVDGFAKSFNVPPIAGSTKVIGLTVNYNISNLKVVNIGFEKDVVTLVPNQGLRIQISGGTGDFTTDWAWSLSLSSEEQSQLLQSYPTYGDEDAAAPLADAKVLSPRDITSGKGKATIKNSGGTFDLTIGIGMLNDNINFTISSVTIDMGTLDITITEGQGLIPNWLYNALISLFKSQIASAFNNAVTDALQTDIGTLINQAIVNLHLSHYPLPEPFPPGFFGNFALASAPVITSDFLALPLKAEIDYQDKTAPFPPRPIPNTLNNAMIQIIVNDFVFDSLAYALFETGMLSFNLTNADLPSWLPIKFNTNIFKSIIPSIYKAFPDDEFFFNLAIIAPPDVTILGDSKPSTGAPVNRTGINLSTQIALTMNINLSNGTVTPAMVIHVNLTAAAAMSLVNDTISGAVQFESFKSRLAKSYVGKIDISLMQFLLNFVFNSVLNPFVNTFLKENAFTLPTVAGIYLFVLLFIFLNFAFANTLCDEK